MFDPALHALVLSSGVLGLQLGRNFGIYSHNSTRWYEAEKAALTQDWLSSIDEDRMFSVFH